jgi:hypothetical protein
MSVLSVAASERDLRCQKKYLVFPRGRDVEGSLGGRHRPFGVTFELARSDRLTGKDQILKIQVRFLRDLEDKDLQSSRRIGVGTHLLRSLAPSASKEPAAGRACSRDQGGPTASATTKGRLGGNEPIGKRAVRSPARSRSEASRNAATNVA